MAISSLARPKVQTITATGGNVVFDLPLPDRGQVLRIHRFTSSSDFTVTAGSGLVEVLIQAGGGGGGGSNTDYWGAGGGAGGLLVQTYSASATEDVGSGSGVYPVVVGSFGAGGSWVQNGFNGGDSSAFGLTAVGGGGGARGTTSAIAGNNGGSGGGGAHGGQHGTAVFGQGAVSDDFPATYRGSLGGGLSLTLDFDGVPRVYARATTGLNERQNGNPAGNQLFDLGLPGAGGRPGSNSTGPNSNATGGAGGSGMVIIRYPVRSL